MIASGPMDLKRDGAVSAAHLLRWVLAAVFAVLFINTAWVSDDAYIILRTVDNALHGYGLRWNVAERVQSYTCPLWTLILCGGCRLTGEYYFTTVAISFLLSASVVYLVGWRLASSAWVGAAGLAALISSKAFMDYTSSGLENTLGYLLLALFLRAYGRPPGLKSLFLMSLAASLAMTNRMDTVLLFGFPLMYSAYRFLSAAGLQECHTEGTEAAGPCSANREAAGRTFMASPGSRTSSLRIGRSRFAKKVISLCELRALCVKHILLKPGRTAFRRLCAVVAIGISPFVAWEVFSVIYYGFPFPNTAYAKLHTGIPSLKLLYRGVLYGLDSLARDPLTLTAVGAMLVLAALRGSWRLRWAAAGVAVYLLYTVRVGGDFMSGRFFALPFLAACVITAQIIASRRAAMCLAAICLALGLLGECPTFFAGPSFENKRRPNYIADERGYYYQWTGFWPVLGNGGEPRGAWVDAGRAFRASAPRVVPGGSVGLTGFYAGPAVHIMDRLALCDPLLARMEIPDKAHWRVGHYERRIPAGYMATLETGANQLENPALRRLYDALAVITRGPLWSAERFREIVRINAGYYDESMREGTGEGQ